MIGWLATITFGLSFAMLWAISPAPGKIHPPSSRWAELWCWAFVVSLAALAVAIIVEVSA